MDSSRRTSRRGGRHLVSAVLVMASAVWLTPAPAATASSATATLGTGGSISRKLAGIFATTGTREAFSSPGIADVYGVGRVDLIAAGLDGVVGRHGPQTAALS